VEHLVSKREFDVGGGSSLSGDVQRQCVRPALAADVSGRVGCREKDNEVFREVALSPEGPLGAGDPLDQPWKSSSLNMSVSRIAT
jgi:hypothetical protein